MPKETVRRKINELNRDQIITRKRKKDCFKTFNFYPSKTKTFNKNLISVFTCLLKIFIYPRLVWPPVDAKNIEEFTRENFTLVWRFFFRFKIPFLIRQRKFHGDLETFIVAGTIFANNIVRLKEKYKDNPITKK